MGISIKDQNSSYHLGLRWSFSFKVPLHDSNIYMLCVNEKLDFYILCDALLDKISMRFDNVESWRTVYVHEDGLILSNIFERKELYLNVGDTMGFDIWTEFRWSGFYVHPLVTYL